MGDLAAGQVEVAVGAGHIDAAALALGDAGVVVIVLPGVVSALRCGFGFGGIPGDGAVFHVEGAVGYLHAAALFRVAAGDGHIAGQIDGAAGGDDDDGDILALGPGGVNGAAGDNAVLDVQRIAVTDGDALAGLHGDAVQDQDDILVFTLQGI